MAARVGLGCGQGSHGGMRPESVCPMGAGGPWGALGDTGPFPHLRWAEPSFSACPVLGSQLYNPELLRERQGLRLLSGFLQSLRF